MHALFSEKCLIISGRLTPAVVCQQQNNLAFKTQLVAQTLNFSKIKTLHINISTPAIEVIARQCIKQKLADIYAFFFMPGGRLDFSIKANVAVKFAVLLTDEFYMFI